MRKVIDKNYAQDPGLEEYLRADINNKVVITDYFCMECCNGINPIKNASRSVEILSRYPKQVIILKYTSPATKIGGILLDPQVCLEDPEQTREFARFCYDVRMAAQGEEYLAAQILRYGALASQHLDGILENSTDYAQAINNVRRVFDAEELTVLRRGDPLSGNTIQKVVQQIFLLALFLLRDHVGTLIDRADIASLSLVHNTFIFRFAISSFLMTLRFLENGGVANAKPAKLRNAIIDMAYVAYATFFDGILTREKKVQEIYIQSRFFVENI
jgi:hypothetical protein